MSQSDSYNATQHTDASLVNSIRCPKSQFKTTSGCTYHHITGLDNIDSRPCLANRLFIRLVNGGINIYPFCIHQTVVSLVRIRIQSNATADNAVWVILLDHKIVFRYHQWVYQVLEWAHLALRYCTVCAVVSVQMLCYNLRREDRYNRKPRPLRAKRL
jgi:hypothetical protein